VLPFAIKRLVANAAKFESTVPSHSEKILCGKNHTNSITSMETSIVLQLECNRSKLVCFRDAVHNKLVLEKEVTDLCSQKARFEEREQREVSTA
jgi:hypothetical protein